MIFHSLISSLSHTFSTHIWLYCVVHVEFVSASSWNMLAALLHLADDYMLAGVC